MIAPDQAVSEFALPALDFRALARRASVPMLIGLSAAAFLTVGGGRVHAITSVLHRALGVNGYWTAAGIVFECASLAGYVALLAYIAGRATGRIGIGESAQITLAGAAATRLLPTAGAGGAALTLWSLRRAGLASVRAARTLLAFLVVLYAVFLVAIVIAGTPLALRILSNHGPVALSAIPAAAALLAITTALVLAFAGPSSGESRDSHGAGLRGRGRRVTQLLADGVRDACEIVRSHDPRLLGAVAYWTFDAAVLWAMLHAFGRAPSIAVVALAYFVGQVANTLPLPGSVSGGIAAVLIAFGVPAAVALPAVLAYRTIAVWLPVPVAIGSISHLRATVGRWSAEDAASASEPVAAANAAEAPVTAAVV